MQPPTTHLLPDAYKRLIGDDANIFDDGGNSRLDFVMQSKASLSPSFVLPLPANYLLPSASLPDTSRRLPMMDSLDRRVHGPLGLEVAPAPVI